MKTDICQLYNDFKGRENTWQGGHIRPASFASWLHEIQIEIQNELLKLLGNNQLVEDNLRVFQRSVQVPISSIGKNGIVQYPKDYRRFIDLRFYSKGQDEGAGVICSDIPILTEKGSCRKLTEEEKAEAQSSDELCERSIDKVPNNKWGAVCGHTLIGPSLTNIYSTQYDAGFKVMPKNIGYVILDYYCIPERPIFKFTRDAKGLIVCAPGCKNLIWGEEMIPEIMARLKKRYGGFTKDGESYAMGEQERRITTS